MQIKVIRNDDSGETTESICTIDDFKAVFSKQLFNAVQHFKKVEGVTDTITMTNTPIDQILEIHNDYTPNTFMCNGRLENRFEFYLV